MGYKYSVGDRVVLDCIYGDTWILEEGHIGTFGTIAAHGTSGFHNDYFVTLDDGTENAVIWEDNLSVITTPDLEISVDEYL